MDKKEDERGSDIHKILCKQTKNSTQSDFYDHGNIFFRSTIKL